MLVRAGNRGGVREGWVGVVYCHIKPGDLHPGIVSATTPDAAMHLDNNFIVG